MEQQIIREDLHHQGKGPSNSLNRLTRQASRMSNHHLNDAGQKLRYLQGRIRWLDRAADRRDKEIQQNEEEWEQIREKEREREPEWKRLDKQARAYWAGDRSVYIAEDEVDRTPEMMKEVQPQDEFDIAAVKIQLDVEENARQAAAALRIQKLEDEQMQQEEEEEEEDDVPSWEDEYGTALEEEAGFTAPTRQVSMLNLEDRVLPAHGEQADDFDALATALLDKGDQASAETALFARPSDDSVSENDASGSAEGAEAAESSAVVA